MFTARCPRNTRLYDSHQEQDKGVGKQDQEKIREGQRDISIIERRLNNVYASSADIP